MPDPVLDLERHSGKLLGAHTCPTGKIADMAVELLDLLLLGKLLETKEKDDVVREDDDLARLRFLDQAPGDALPPLVVERGDGIVEHDGGTIVGRSEFGEERRDRKTPLFPFAHDLRKLDARSTREDETVIEHSFGAARFLELDLDMAKAKTRELATKNSP